MRLRETPDMKIRYNYSCLLTLFVAMLGLSSCQHKDLCYRDSNKAQVKVVFDWSQVVEKADPEGMVLFFYPVDGGKPLRYDLKGKYGGVIELPVGHYDVLFYNNDTELNLFGDVESFTKHHAFTRSSHLLSRNAFGKAAETAPRGGETAKQRIVGSPEQMWGGPYGKVFEVVSDACDLCKLAKGNKCGLVDIEDEGIVLTLYPQKYVGDVTVIGRNIIGVKRARDAKGALTGMSPDINIKTRRPGDEQATLPFEVVLDKEKSNLYAHFNTFRHPEADGKHYLDLYFVLEDGQKIHRRYDVTDQVRTAPDPWHIVIIIDEILLPPAIEDDSGLDPIIDEWQTEEVDIILH